VSGHLQFVDSVQAWIISVPVAEGAKSRVIGPLFTSPQTRSYAAFHGGAVFTENDVVAHGETPVIHLGGDGHVLRLGEAGSVDELNVAEDMPTWKRSSSPSAVNRPSGDESRLRSAAGDVLVQAERGNEICIYDGHSGQPKAQDEWISGALRDILSRNDLCNRRMWLSDDLSAIAVAPRDRCVQGNGSSVTNFQVRGKQYDRATHGLIYRRPRIDPDVFTQSDNVVDVVGVYVIDSEVTFLETDKAGLRLVNQEGRIVNVVARPAEWGMTSARPLGVRHDAKAGELVVVGTSKPSRSGDQRDDVSLEMVRWRYQDKAVSRTVTSVSELFTRQGDMFVPRAARAPQ
jgi:hypothetical protein